MLRAFLLYFVLSFLTISGIEVYRGYYPFLPVLFLSIGNAVLAIALSRWIVGSS